MPTRASKRAPRAASPARRARKLIMLVQYGVSARGLPTRAQLRRLLDALADQAAVAISAHALLLL